MEDLTISRRRFLKAGAVLGLGIAATGLSGCGSWVPRSAQIDDGVEDLSMQGQRIESVDDGLVLIEGGAFLMGSPSAEPWRGEDEIQHEVTVSSFYLAAREVTQAEYSTIMGSNPSAFKGGELPVESVTWLDAVAFCNALSQKEGLTFAYEIDGENVSWDRSADGYRLPTEAEWEYACRAGTTMPFNTETSISADTEANYYGTYPYEIENNYFSQGNLETSPGIYRQETVEVGNFGANRWGLYDMHGNVAEWVWDVYGPYPEVAVEDPIGADAGALRVNRGGGWNDFAKNLRSAYRAALPADGSSKSVGFRIARNAQPGSGIAAAAASDQATGSGDALIVYFTWSGNTAGIAQEIAQQTGFETVSLELEHPYSSNYSTCLDEAQRDQNTQARPALKTRIDDFDRYGTVLIGYPNWWASIPMPIATLLESYDFSGKTILPFCSNGGGGLGQSVSAISKLAPNSVVKDGLSIYYSGGSNLSSDVSQWLEKCGVAN